jgi:excisionase family DNA binding protein
LGLKTVDPERRFVSVKEIETMAPVCQRTIYNAIRQGRLKSVRIGRRVLVPVQELENYLQRK